MVFTKCPTLLLATDSVTNLIGVLLLHSVTLSPFGFCQKEKQLSFQKDLEDLSNTIFYCTWSLTTPTPPVFFVNKSDNFLAHDEYGYSFLLATFGFMLSDIL